LYYGGEAGTEDFMVASVHALALLVSVSINSSGYSASFLTKTVGTAKAVTVLGVTLSGGDAGNYTVSQPSGLTADITAKNLTISEIGSATCKYNEETSATSAGQSGRVR